MPRKRTKLWLSDLEKSGKHFVHIILSDLYNVFAHFSVNTLHILSIRIPATCLTAHIAVSALRILSFRTRCNAVKAHF